MYIGMKGVVYGVNPIGWVTCRWLKLFWPGCVLTRVNGLSLRELDPPELPGAEWVRCRTVLGGICGSDLAIINQRQPHDSILRGFSTLPSVFGHENVAVVSEVGAGVDPSWVGKRVTADSGLPCQVRGIDPPCRSCREGRLGSCENFGSGGEGRYQLPAGSCIGYCAAVGGSWSEQFVAHVSQLIEPPEDLSDRQLVLTDPLACSLHGVLRADLSDPTRVLVYGAGALGLGVVWALRAIGWTGRIDVIARHKHQAQVATAFGADEIIKFPSGAAGRFETIAERTDGRVVKAFPGSYMLSGGYDVVFECVGSSSTMEEAIKWTRAGGQTVLIGTGHGRGTDLTAVWFAEVNVLGSSGRAMEIFQGRKVHTCKLVHELMRASAPDTSVLLTHTFPLDDYQAALSAAIHKHAHRSIKVAFAFER